MKIKNAFKKGFTLIELMIVIVILGILMGTLLPKLSGVQARARDTARISDLTNIAQALEAYYNDEGSYPSLGNGSGNCLAMGTVDGNGVEAVASPNAYISTTESVARVLGAYLKGNKTPTPRISSLNSVGCIGSYFYKPLKKDGVQNAAYVLATDLETYQKANFALGKPDANTLVTDKLTNATYSGIAKSMGRPNKSFDTNLATSTIYVMIP